MTPMDAAVCLECAVCGVAATLKCAGCRGVVYCGKEHQRCDWRRGHKAACQCYEIARNDALGRHMRATRHIRRGEIVLCEEPLVTGPKVACRPLCLGCHRTLPPPPPPQAGTGTDAGNYYKCSRCHWPLCGPACELSPHHEPECHVMARRQFKAKLDYVAADAVTDVARKESAYCVILPLRCMLLKEQRRSDYERLLALEDHLAERLATPLYRVLRANLVTFFQTILDCRDWTEAEVLRIAAILDTNAFEVRTMAPVRKVRAIYPRAAMISHDCIANVRHVFDEQQRIRFIAKVAIAKGDIIATTYTQPLRSTLMRRQHLLQAKCFACSCRRCIDPTELATFIGAITCTKCKIGKILSSDPLDDAASWRCQLCSHALSAKQVVDGNGLLEREIASLHRSSPRAFEAFLHRHRDTLPERNTHMLQVKYALTQLYGNVAGYLLHEMDDAALARKIAYCRELLEIADIVDSGDSIFRGNLLLDLQEGLVVQAKRQHLSGSLMRDQVQETLAQAVTLLEEAATIMQHSPEMRDTLKQRTDALQADLNRTEQQLNVSQGS